MITKQIEIGFESGLTARAAATFVQHTNRYSSDIYIQLESGAVDAKSIMGIISLGIRKGTIITIQCEGVDEVRAMADLEELLKE